MTYCEFKLHGLDIYSILDRLMSAVLILDGECSIVCANRIATFMADKPSDRVVGSRPGDAFSCINADNDRGGCGHGKQCRGCRLRKTIDDTFSDGINRTFMDASLEMNHTGRREYSLSTTYIPEENLVLLTMEDITDIKILENELLESQKLLGAVETAGAVCHEINQPLQVISCYLHLLEAKKGNLHDLGACVGSMQEQMEKLGAITRKLQNLKLFATRDYVAGRNILDLDKSSAI